jgi:hypothetical protein
MDRVRLDWVSTVRESGVRVGSALPAIATWRRSMKTTRCYANCAEDAAGRAGAQVYRSQQTWNSGVGLTESIGWIRPGCQRTRWVSTSFEGYWHHKHILAIWALPESAVALTEQPEGSITARETRASRKVIGLL